MEKHREYSFPAIQIKQGERCKLYNFAVDGKLLPEFTAISRAHRDDGHAIHGYQRPEVIAHIKEIRDYLESGEPMLPNTLVIAFDSRVRFEPDPNGCSNSYCCTGKITIPAGNGDSGNQKPGWLVDGQQRVAAIREANISSFPICVTAFITDDIEEQRTQFILVNSTKPLPKGLVHELLPGTKGKLPRQLLRRQLPAQLLERLNFDPDSPLKAMIKTPTNAEGLVADNSILKMLENSLSDGALYQYRHARDGQADLAAMLELLKSFWRAVSQAFPEAWGLPPRKSRLMHGAGIAGLGFLMDAITDRLYVQGIPSTAQYLGDLEPLRQICRWTNGYWDFGPGLQRKWNEIQNVPRDVQVLVNYLLFEYKNRVWNNGAARVERRS